MTFNDTTPPREPTTNGSESQSGKPEERETLPESPLALLELIGGSGKEALQRRAYSALARKAGKQPNIVRELAENLPDDAPLLRSWCAAELFWSLRPELRDPHVREVLGRRLPADLFAVGDRVLQSAWVSQDRLPQSAAPLDPLPRLDFHPLLERSAGGRWPAAGLDVNGDVPLFDADLDLLLPELAALEVPVARELVVRRGILSIGRPRVDIDTVERRTLKATVKALELHVAKLANWLKRTPEDLDALNQLLLLPRLAGRSPDLWDRLDRARAQLTKDAPDTPAHAQAWATIMVGMPSASRDVIAALTDVPDTALMALLEQALRADLGAMVGAIQDISRTRALSGDTTTMFWQRLGSIAPNAPRLEAWWRNFMVPHAPPGVVELDERTNVELLFSRIHDASVDEVVDTSLKDRISQLGDSDRLRAAARLLMRIQHLTTTERDRAFAEMAVYFGTSLGRVSALVADVERLLGAVPGGVAEACRRATDIIERESALFERSRGRRAGDVAVTTTARRAPEITEIVPALHSLGRAQSEEQQSRAIARMREHLAWVASESPHLLAPVASELETLPPEAVGVVLGVALSSREPTLLSAVSSTLVHVRAVEVIWRACLGSQLPALASGLTLPDGLARASAEALEWDISKSREELRRWRAGRPFDEPRMRVTEAFAAVRARLTLLHEQLLQLTNVL
jgi:hypothetical protein